MHITLIVDRVAHCFHANAAWAAFTGQPGFRARHAGWTETITPGEAAAFHAAFAAGVDADEPFDLPLGLRRFDGRDRWFTVRFTPISGTGGDVWIGAFTDAAARDGASLAPDSPARGTSATRITDARLRRLFDANVVGIVIANNAGAILEANDAFLSMLGYTREELDDGLVDWRRLTPDEWLHLDEKAIVEMESRGIISPYEKEYVRRDGTRVPVSLGGARIAGTADEQICYIVDLSEIRRAEAALRRSESRFRRLTDAGVIGIVTTRGADDTIIEANDEFLRIVGFNRDDVASQRLRWTELTPPEWRAAGERAMAELRRHGRFAPLQKEYYRKDGSRVPVLVGGALLDAPVEELVCYVLDLSEQQAATRRIAESERRYRALTDALPQMIMISDVNRQLTYINAHYATYTGYDSQGIAEHWREIIHPDDLPAIDRARAHGGPYEVEYRVRRAADGAYRWHFARCLEMPGDSPDERWLATAMDIDDRRRAEESLRFIERAGSLLAQSLDLNTTFATLLDLVVPEFGDWAVISLRNDAGEIETAVARHRDPDKADAVREIVGKRVFVESAASVTLDAIRTREPQLRSQITADEIEAGIKEPFVRWIEQLGYGSTVSLPVFSGDDVIGSFTIVSAGDARRYTPADLPPLGELARRAGYAIDNARRFEREHRVASLLQEAALPRKLPAVAGIAFDGYYQAGRQEALIGGDWYDALVVADGRIVISVGDVAGSGLRAAVLMGNVRQVIRGAAHVYADPMMMLEIADRTLRSEHEHTMVTAFVGVIDTVNRSMRYASAGHVPALLRDSDGTVSELRAPGLPLGCRDLGSSESRTVILEPGSSLLLYTDGLVEWSRDLIAGEALLRSEFARRAPGADPQPARALVDGILPRTGARDDVAALMVTVTSPYP